MIRRLPQPYQGHRRKAKIAKSIFVVSGSGELPTVFNVVQEGKRLGRDSDMLSKLASGSER